MLYMRKRFSVPVSGPKTTQEEWDAIFNPQPDTNLPKCPHCGKHAEQEVRNFDRTWGDGDVHCTACGKRVRSFDSG